MSPESCLETTEKLHTFAYSLPDSVAARLLAEDFATSYDMGAGWVIPSELSLTELGGVMNLRSLNLSGSMLVCVMMSTALFGCLSDKSAQTGDATRSAAAAGNLVEVQRPVPSGVNVRLVDADGRTPLFDAVKEGKRDAVEQLIAKGADVNARDRYGVTPLFLAAAFGQKEIAELLIAKGATVEVKNNFGGTPLHFAATFGHKDVAELLIANGADVQDQGYAFGKYGVTPLHQAAYRGHKDVAELLITKGAKVNVKDKKGRTPLVYALSSKHNDVVKLLRAHGGK